MEETTKDDVASEYFQEALECLRRHFRDITYVGPSAYAGFYGRPDLRAQAFSTVQRYLELIDMKMT